MKLPTKNIKKLLFIIIFWMTFIQVGYAIENDWNRIYGGTSADEGRYIIQTGDGGYIVVGNTESYSGNPDVLLMKLDKQGNIQWSKTFGGDREDYAYSLQPTSDGGFIIVGYTNSFETGYHIYIIKTDALGDTLWTKIYGPAKAYSVEKTSDGNFMIAGVISSGYNNNDLYLLKINPFGDTLWSRKYNVYRDDYANALIETPDSGFIVVGYTAYTTDYVHYDLILLKINKLGDTIWTKRYGGNGRRAGKDIIQAINGGYIITGYSWPYGSDYTYLMLLKIDENGDIVWNKFYKGLDDAAGYSVTYATDSGYIFAGTTNSNSSGKKDIYLVKTDVNGDTLWTAYQGGTETDIPYCINNTADGGYIIAGKTYTHDSDGDLYIVKESYVKLLTPNTRQYLKGGSSYLITWDKLMPLQFSEYVLRYSTNNGQDFSDFIAALDTSTLQYLWIVPYINSDKCKILIQSVYNGDTLAWDVSEENFIIDSDPPIFRNLLSPQNGEFTQRQVVLMWESAVDNLSGIEKYTIEISFDPLFSQLFGSFNLQDTTITLSLADTLYYWRVCAIDSAGNKSNWSSVWQFEVDTHAPNAPLLFSPQNNSWVNTNNVIFEWEEVSKYFKSPVRYVLTVDTTPYFNVPVIIDTTRFTTDTATLPDGSYYWRVKAFDLAGNEGGWSLIWYVGVDGHSPDIPTLITPTNGAWLNSNNVTFQWTGVSKDGGAPVEYIIQVDTSNTFTNPVIHDTVSLNSTNYTLPESYYYWRVRAYDLAGNEGLWTSTWQFVIDKTAPTIDSTTIIQDTANYFGPFVINTKITDNGILQNAILFYRVGATSAWLSDTMAPLANNWYQGLIPEISQTSSSVIEYYIQAEDRAGNTAKDPQTGAYSFTVGINESKEIPKSYVLLAPIYDKNALIVKFGVPEKAHTTLKIYDATGREKDVLLNKTVSAGYHTVEVSLHNLKDGMYFIEIKSKKHRLVKKFIITK